MVGDGALDAGAGDEVVHAVEGAQEGGLAAARGADERGDLVLGDGEVHVLDGVEAAVEDVDVVDVEDGGGAVRAGAAVGGGLGGRADAAGAHGGAGAGHGGVAHVLSSAASWPEAFGGCGDRRRRG